MSRTLKALWESLSPDPTSQIPMSPTLVPTVEGSRFTLEKRFDGIPTTTERNSQVLAVMQSITEENRLLLWMEVQAKDAGTLVQCPNHGSGEIIE